MEVEQWEIEKVKSKFEIGEKSRLNLKQQYINGLINGLEKIQELKAAGWNDHNRKYVQTHIAKYGTVSMFTYIINSNFTNNNNMEMCGVMHKQITHFLDTGRCNEYCYKPFVQIENAIIYFYEMVDYFESEKYPNSIKKELNKYGWDNGQFTLF